MTGMPGNVIAAMRSPAFRRYLAGQLLSVTCSWSQVVALSWVVVEENGQPERAPYVPYQRVEAEVGTGHAVIVSIGPDETLSRAVYRLDEARVDVTSGALSIGDQVGTYLDAGAFEAALRQARA